MSVVYEEAFFPILMRMIPISSSQIVVTRPSMPPYEEYCAEIASLWESRWLTNRGEKHRELETALQGFLDTPNLALFTNGHLALENIVEALELGHDGRNEVITTPFTFVSTTNALARKGLKPVFCDIRSSDYTIDPEKIESLITENTCAIVPVHVYGNLCDHEQIEHIAKKYDLKVIYDAAHAFGVKEDGVSVARFGDASMFSFHATKVFNTIEGGAASFKDPQLAVELVSHANFGMKDSESCDFVGGNAKMNEFAAAMGICNLRHVEEEIAKRKRVAERYFELLSNVPGLSLCIPPANVEHNYAYLPVVVDSDVFGVSRDVIFDKLAEQGIGARKYFYPLVTDFACYREMYSSDTTPIAKRVASQVITLPLYADLPLDEVDRICTVVLECARA